MRPIGSNRFLALGCQVQVSLRRLATFLDEAVQQIHLAIRDAEQHSGDPSAGKRATNFPEAGMRCYRSADGHTDGPTVLERLDIESDDPAVPAIKASEPISNRLRALARPIKDRGNSFIGNRLAPSVAKRECTSCGTGVNSWHHTIS